MRKASNKKEIDSTSMVVQSGSVLKNGVVGRLTS